MSKENNRQLIQDRVVHLAARLQFGTFGFVVVLLLLVAVLLTSILSPNLFPEGQQLVLAPLFLLWLFLLRRYPRLLYSFNKDIKSDSTNTLTGVGVLHNKPGFRILFAPPLQFSLRGHSFDLYDYSPAKLYVGQECKLHFLQASRLLLFVEPLTDSRPNREPNLDLKELELSILRLMTQGLSDKLIARELNLEPATVRTYNSTIYRKLEVSNRKQASKKAMAMGLFDVN